MFKEIISTKFFTELKLASGDQIFFVGGCVRDKLLGKDCKDYDLIVRNIPIDTLIDILLRFGKVDIVGKSFGVIKFWPNELTLAEPLDITLPRTEVSTGEGHTDFEVHFDETLPIKDDLYRRDFTFNTLLLDSDLRLIDYFDGYTDLQNGIINTVSPNSFSEDPLRMFRAVQFACRFNFTFSENTMQSFVKNCQKVNTVSKERVFDEINKVINKGGNLENCILYFNMVGISTFFFKTSFDTSVEIKNKYDFWFVLSEAKLFVKHDTPCGTRLKDLLGVTNDIEKLCNLMQAFVISPSMDTFLSLYNFDKGIINCGLLEFIRFIYIVIGNYPTTVNELAIGGKDLLEMGLVGKQIGEMQKLMLYHVLHTGVKNTSQELLELVGSFIEPV